MVKFEVSSGALSPIGSMVPLYMVTWIPSIYLKCLYMVNVTIHIFTYIYICDGPIWDHLPSIYIYIYQHHGSLMGHRRGKSPRQNLLQKSATTLKKSHPDHRAVEAEKTGGYHSPIVTINSAILDIFISVIIYIQYNIL